MINDYSPLPNTLTLGLDIKARRIRRSIGGGGFSTLANEI